MPLGTKSHLTEDEAALRRVEFEIQELQQDLSSRSLSPFGRGFGWVKTIGVVLVFSATLTFIRSGDLVSFSIHSFELFSFMFLLSWSRGMDKSSKIKKAIEEKRKELQGLKAGAPVRPELAVESDR